MRLVYCSNCWNPIARIAPGSRVEIKCKRCGAKTTVEIKAR